MFGPKLPVGLSKRSMAVLPEAGIGPPGGIPKPQVTAVWAEAEVLRFAAALRPFGQRLFS